MPTTPEIFAHFVRSVIKLCTEPCFCTAEEFESGKCFACNGRGTVRDLERIFVGGTVQGIKVDEDSQKPCTQCNGTGLCERCQGALENVPEEHSHVVMAGVLGGFTHTMAVSRAAEQWNLFNEQWDVMYAWVCRNVELSSPPTEERIHELSEAFFGEEIPRLDKVRATSSTALTEDELRDLGILDETESEKEPNDAGDGRTTPT